MTPEQCNMIVTALQGVSSSIHFVGEILIVFAVQQLIGSFMK